MLAKIKSYLDYVLGLAILILGALFFKKSKEADSLRSELASEQAKGVMRENQQQRNAAKETSDDLESKLKRQLDELERLRSKP